MEIFIDGCDEIPLKRGNWKKKERMAKWTFIKLALVTLGIWWNAVQCQSIDDEDDEGKQS